MNIINNQKFNLAAPIRIQIIIRVAALLSVIFVGISDAAIGRTGIARGHISRFGSIFINNREFDISNAVITVDGRTASEADLELGQVVFVRGLLDDEFPVGIADEEISAAEFFAVLTPGTFLKVEGVEIADTVIVATDIELELDD